MTPKRPPSAGNGLSLQRHPLKSTQKAKEPRNDTAPKTPTTERPSLRRKRQTIVYGYCDRAEASKRLKQLQAEARKPKVYAQPSKEWLAREGTKLSSAATTPSASFLGLAAEISAVTRKAASHESSKTHSSGEKEDSAARNEARLSTDGTSSSSKPLELPTRDKSLGNSVSAASRTKLSIFRLVQ